MNVWIDICHIPQYNFYRNLILRLAEEGNTVYVTVLRRGRLADIVEKEIGEKDRVHISIVGRHRLTRLSAILEANLLRNLQLFYWKLGKNIDVALSNGYSAALVSWLCGVRNYSFDDDPQTIDYKPKVLFNTGTFYCLYRIPDGVKLSPKVTVLPVLKEWAYLSPDCFKPDSSVLEEYGVKPREYVFLREASIGTVNYAGQERSAVAGIAKMIPANVKVLLSLEDKKNRNMYPDDWILIEEPVMDIHSLIYFSMGLVSSGDSMAREAALLGVPSYYLGIRHDMPANRVAMETAGMQCVKTIAVDKWIGETFRRGLLNDAMVEERRKKISAAFADINKVMKDCVYGLYA